ncbi:hypothetical protein [Acinetobacter sp. ANC 4648]|nr:hypothetical protein [Acinetobacter sp. ANC 4648]
MTNSLLWLKTSICIGMILFFGLAILLWSKTPELFEYFNQAFCAH